MPLVRLNEIFGVATREAQPDEIQIVVYADQDYRCGLIVNRIIDIVETELQLPTKKSDEDNLLGTSIIQQRVTDVLNLRRLARRPAASRFMTT